MQRSLPIYASTATRRRGGGWGRRRRRRWLRFGRPGLLSSVGAAVVVAVAALERLAG